VIVVLCSWSGRPARPQTQHGYHYDTKVKPEAVTAVIELLMMGGKTPKTCWAVNKRQDNKLKNCCTRLVIYLNCTMMHGLTNLKFYIQILAHSVCKMWIIHEPEKDSIMKLMAFWREKRRVCSMFKLLSTYICWTKYMKCNIWRVAVRPSYIEGARFLKVKAMSVWDWQLC
jgi:hypothetical protein